jgi:hypothetical protein
MKSVEQMVHIENVKIKERINYLKDKTVLQKLCKFHI